MSNAGALVGRLAFFRGHGVFWIDLVRPWLLPLLGGGAALKYLTGLPTSRVLPLVLGLAVLTEAAAILLGWLEWRSGATRAQYDMQRVADPYKIESLTLLRAIRDAVRADSVRVGDRLMLFGDVVEVTGLRRDDPRGVVFEFRTLEHHGGWREW